MWAAFASFGLLDLLQPVRVLPILLPIVAVPWRYVIRTCLLGRASTAA